MRKSVLPILLTFCLLPAVARADSALMPLNNQDLRDLDRGDGLIGQDPFSTAYEPRHVGAFLLYPLLEVKGAYNDNIYANDTRETSDYIGSVKPQAVLQKPYGRHFFEWRGAAEIQRALEESSEDIENYDTAFRARLEARNDLIIPLEAGYKIDHAERKNSRSSQIAATPFKDETLHAKGGLIYTPGRLKLSLLGRAASLRLDDNTDLISGAAIDRDVADRNVYDFTAETAYEFHPNWAPFIQGSYHREDFQNLRGGVNQDNTTWRGLAGLNFDYKGLVTGRLGAGADWRDFDAGSVRDTTNFALEGSITANISRSTQLLGDISRITITDNDLLAGLVSTKTGLGVKHELRPDLYLLSDAGYTLDDFEASTREDDIYSAGLSLQYISGPALRLALEYDYEQRESSSSGLDFTQNIIMLRLLGSL